MGTLRFNTTESGRSIRRQMYINDRVNSFFECHIVVPVVHSDSVIDAIKSLYIMRKYDDPHSYDIRGGDKIYRTMASLSPDGEKFSVDITVKNLDSHRTPAVIAMSDTDIGGPAKRFAERLKE